MSTFSPFSTVPTTEPSPRTYLRVRRAGAWCLGAGLLGAAQGLAILTWPPDVSVDRYSYPFTATGFLLAQISFFVQHLPLVAGVAALLQVPAVRRSRTARLSTWTAVVGLTLLTAMELVTITARDAATDSSHATMVNNLYGPPVVLTGLGMLALGAALLRRSTDEWSGARWLPAVVLALGVYVFVPLTPAIMGSFTAGRLGIIGWMLLFAALGYGMTRLDRGDD